MAALLLALPATMMAQSVSVRSTPSVASTAASCDCQQWRADWQKRHEDGLLNGRLFDGEWADGSVSVALQTDDFELLLPELFSKFPAHSVLLTARSTGPPTVDCDTGFVTGRFNLKFLGWSEQNYYPNFFFTIRVDVQWDPRTRFVPHFPLRGAELIADPVVVDLNINEFQTSTLNNLLPLYFNWIHPVGGVPIPPGYPGCQDPPLAACFP